MQSPPLATAQRRQSAADDAQFQEAPSRPYATLNQQHASNNSRTLPTHQSYRQPSYQQPSQLQPHPQLLLQQTSKLHTTHSQLDDEIKNQITQLNSEINRVLKTSRSIRSNYRSSQDFQKGSTSLVDEKQIQRDIYRKLEEIKAKKKKSGSNHPQNANSYSSLNPFNFDSLYNQQF